MYIAWLHAGVIIATIWIENNVFRIICLQARAALYAYCNTSGGTGTLDGHLHVAVGCTCWVEGNRCHTHTTHHHAQHAMPMGRL